MGTLARIKPVVTIGKNGGVEVAGKCMGKARAMKEMQALLEANPADPDYPVYGVYSGAKDNTLELMERLGDAGAPPEQIYSLGPVIGAHIGPGAYGIVYVEKNG